MSTSHEYLRDLVFTAQFEEMHSKFHWQAKSCVYPSKNRPKIPFEKIGPSFLKDDIHIVTSLKMKYELKGHSGCVNTIRWNEDGNLLISGSDDKKILIYDLFAFEVIKSINTPHESNIFSAEFLPCHSDAKVVSCEYYGMVALTDCQENKPIRFWKFCCLNGFSSYKTLTNKYDPFGFYVCGETGSVLYFDIRTKQSCICSNCETNVVLNIPPGIIDMDIHPIRSNIMAVACKDGNIMFFDNRRFPSRQYHRDLISFYHHPEKPNQSCTCIKFNSVGSELLINLSGGMMHLINTESYTPATQNFKFDSPFSYTMHTSSPKDQNDMQDINHNENVEAVTNIGNNSWNTTSNLSILEQQNIPNSDDRISLIRFEPINDGIVGNEDEDSEYSLSTTPSSRYFSSDSSPSLNRSNFDEPGVETEISFSRASDQDHHDDNISVDSQGEMDSRASPPTDQYDMREFSELEGIYESVLLETEIFTSRRLDHTDHRNRMQSISDKLYHPPYCHEYKGHRNHDTMMKECNFWGNEYVICGSDCGHVFIWNKVTEKVVNVLKGDGTIVNCVQPHPFYPILACSGIDNTIKIYAPFRDLTLSPYHTDVGSQMIHLDEILEANDFIVENHHQVQTDRLIRSILLLRGRR